MKLFIDSDVILDYLWHREDWTSAEKLLALAEENKILVVTTAIVMANLFYILSKKSNRVKAKKITQELRSILSIASITQDDVDWALQSPMADFEDALQYSAAQRAKVDFLVTRNVKDYQKEPLHVVKSAEAVRLIVAV